MFLTRISANFLLMIYICHDVLIWGRFFFGNRCKSLISWIFSSLYSHFLSFDFFDKIYYIFLHDSAFPFLKVKLLELSIVDFLKP